MVTIEPLYIPPSLRLDHLFLYLILLPSTYAIPNQSSHQYKLATLSLRVA